MFVWKKKLPKEKIFTKKNAKWIRLFEKFDPIGAGRISTEDFLIAIDSKDFRQDPRVASKRAALKSKVLEYGTSFITIEEFIEVCYINGRNGHTILCDWHIVDQHFL
ncbi:hypothetical protein BLA29_000796 [Euroglyphus maynei]|uniref:EF-hand domain-containing protein n=1 Tax=Euroglyphus maynei TaxID=6958 RepID=A0A1Y3BH00_EURMA|nr:hypothetical protein BLA29_000796 [Euroglyphus maynei]